MHIKGQMTRGVFIREGKGRFLCYVLIYKEICECYVPSASKIKNYLRMEGKEVLLLINKGDDLRTKYSLFAVKFYNKYIILNLLIVNKILEEYLEDQYGAVHVYREKYFGNYKSDFIVSGEDNMIVEAKGIISSKKIAIFPTVYCERAIKQLQSILEFLKAGYKVHYYIIALSPIVSVVNISKDLKFQKYTNSLNECIRYGMVIKGFNIFFQDNEVKIYKNIKLLF